MGKVLIATFDDEEQIDFDELMIFLKKKSNIALLNTLSDNGNGVLEYNNFIIDPQYRTVDINLIVQ